MKSKGIHVPLLLSLGLLGCFLFLVETTRLLSIGGASVNLILVFFSLLIFFADSFVFVLVPLILVVLFSLLTAPFWICDMLVFAAVIALFYFLKGFLTGNRFIDFLIVLALATVFLHGILALLFGAPWFSLSLVLELCSGLILGAIGFGALKMLKLA